MTALLPPHLQRVADVVEAPLLPPLDAADLAAPVARLTAALVKEAARLPEGSSVVVDTFRLRRALECPASLAPDCASEQPFAWSPLTSARWLGMKALEAFVSGHTVDIAAAVAAACAGTGTDDRAAEGHLWGPPLWLRDEADGPARAATVATATQWAEQAAQWVPWARWYSPRCRLRFDPCRRSWPGRRQAVSVRPRWDADLRPFAETRSRVQVLLLTTEPNSVQTQASVRLAALGGWLAEPRPGCGPARTVAIYPAHGEVVSVDVDRTLLEAAVDDAITTAAALVDAALALPLPAIPGPPCSWCPRAYACPDGTEWLARPDRRVAGLPVG